jgi:hypothetical protein
MVLRSFDFDTSQTSTEFILPDKLKMTVDLLKPGQLIQPYLIPINGTLSMTRYIYERS